MGRPGDPYFQPPIGFYCDMYGQEGPPPHPQDMPLPPPGAPHAPFLLSTQDESGMLAAAAHLDGHQAPNGCGDGSYMMDEGAMRPPHSSPNMPLGAQDETFRVLHGFHQTSQDLKTETSVPPGW
uniref:Uncharacterized protein n=1 Tax=Plectus sambesii TaxID=2011161 RepID=A0A914W1V7_9BILA